jgi:sulfide:quinone oxidoreductase
MTEDGWIPVDKFTLKTRFSGVYAVGDVNSVGTPKAGVFSEGAAKAAAASIIAEYQNSQDSEGYDGKGSCFIQFGMDSVGRVDVDFYSGPTPTGTFVEPSAALIADKAEFGSSREARWFGT